MGVSLTPMLSLMVMVMTCWKGRAMDLLANLVPPHHRRLLIAGQQMDPLHPPEMVLPSSPPWLRLQAVTMTVLLVGDLLYWC